jgi:hypothetical protein
MPPTPPTPRRKIRELLSRRSDLSTFLVHLTRSEGEETAKTRLQGILRSGKIEARNVFGAAKNLNADADLASQKCVCFTETPLEHVSLLLGPIEGRDCEFGPYGIAITKKVARKQGVNPVWYLDRTPGQVSQWELANSVDRLRDAAWDRTSRTFRDGNVEKILPFIEHMGRGRAVERSSGGSASGATLETSPFHLV